MAGSKEDRAGIGRPAGDAKVAWNLVVVDGPEGEILEVEQARAIFDALEWLNREGSEEG